MVCLWTPWSVNFCLIDIWGVENHSGKFLKSKGEKGTHLESSQGHRGKGQRELMLAVENVVHLTHIRTTLQLRCGQLVASQRNP